MSDLINEDSNLAYNFNDDDDSSDFVLRPHPFIPVSKRAQHVAKRKSMQIMEEPSTSRLLPIRAQDNKTDPKPVGNHSH